MGFFRIVSAVSAVAEPQVPDGGEEKKGSTGRRIVIGILIAVLLVLIGIIVTCKTCGSGTVSEQVVRPVTDVTNLSVVLINGEATFFWEDSADEYLDHLEVSWDPDGGTPLQIEKGVQKAVIPAPGIREGVQYTVTVKAVDVYGNKSANTNGGKGLLFKKPESAGSPFSGAAYGAIVGIAGTPVAGQATLSWHNLDDSEYDHIEITFDPNHERLIRVPKGVESKMLRELLNGVEHTFYVAAVDADGNRKPVKDLGLFLPDFATESESVYGKPSQGQVTLEWKETNDSDLTHYEVFYGPDGDKPIQVPKGSNSHTIAGLSDDTEYEFTVYAINRSGYKHPLMGVALYTPEAPTFADANVGAVTGRPVTGQITLDWEDPKNSNLDHIEIIYQPGGEKQAVIVGKGIQTKTFTGMSDDQEYTFIVYGVDAQGNKRAITGVRLSTPEVAFLSGAPVSGQVTLNWTDPNSENLDHIEIAYTPGGEVPVIVGPGVETHTFTNLSDDQEYNFSISAIMKSNARSAVANAELLVPELPLLIGSPVDGQLSLKWTDPENIDVKHIEVVYYPDGEMARVIAKGEKNQTFAGLNDGTEYAFRVYAVDGQGNKYPVKDAAFYTPEVAVAPPPPPPSPPPPPPSNIPDGGPGSLRWRPTGDTSFGESTVLALSYGQAGNGVSRWVAGGTDGKMAYSNDNGVRWSPITDHVFGSFSIMTITYANGRWLAGGGNGKMMYSTNAVNWTAVRNTYFALDQNIATIAYANGKWLAGGSNGIMVSSTDNGVTWTVVGNSTFGASTVNTIAYYEGQGRWVAGGADGKMAYSNDNGVTWTAVNNSTFGKSDITTVIYDSGRWMAGGYGTRIAWSADGITWRTAPRPFYILGLGYNGDRWVAGGQVGRMSWTKDGGDSWTEDEVGKFLFGESWVQAVAFGKATGTKGRWLSGGQNGKIIYADEQ